LPEEYLVSQVVMCTVWETPGWSDVFPIGARGGKGALAPSCCAPQDHDRTSGDFAVFQKNPKSDLRLPQKVVILILLAAAASRKKMQKILKRGAKTGIKYGKFGPKKYGDCNLQVVAHYFICHIFLDNKSRKFVMKYS